MANEVLTQDEQQVFRLLARGHPRKEIPAELNLSDDAVLVHVLSIVDKLGRASGGSPLSDPPPPPLAAAAALAVPRQRAEDVPTHVGRHLPREGGKA